MTDLEALQMAINAFGGIGSCATHCPCCQMLAGIARKKELELEAHLSRTTQRPEYPANYQDE